MKNIVNYKDLYQYFIENGINEVYQLTMRYKGLFDSRKYEYGARNEFIDGIYYNESRKYLKENEESMSTNNLNTLFEAVIFYSFERIKEAELKYIDQKVSKNKGK